MSGKGGRNKTLTPRDIEILNFLWRWKILSTASIVVKFFPTPSGPHAAYRRLCHLQKDGLIEKQIIHANKLYWCLTKKGFARVLPSLPPGATDGFRSEAPNHDALVTAAHLGPWTSVPETVHVFSEQELRCLPLEQYPTWVPNTDLHRPDGYWLTTFKEKRYLIALEVELHQKADKEYDYVARFYSEHPSIFRVLWVIPTRGFGAKLQTIFKKKAPKDALIHNFVLAADLSTLGWTAPIILGQEAGNPLAYLIDRRVLKTPENFNTLWNLDGRLCPYNLSTSAKLALNAFCNCPVFQTVPIPNTPLVLPPSYPHHSNLIVPSSQTSLLQSEG